MGAEIDRLEVQVEAQAQKANVQLESLIKKLDRVSASLAGVNSRGLATMGAGVNKLVNAMANMNTNTKTADFTRLTNNIAKLTAVKAQELYGASSAITAVAKSINSLQGVSGSSMQVAEMAKNISKLGGTNVQRAITNLPQLATALNNLMITLSKSPAVSQDVIRLTNSLANLASQGGKAGTAANTVSASMNTQARSAERASKSTHKLNSVIGTLYQRYFMLTRAARKLWGSTNSSMDFLETVNYFEVAMRKIGDDAASQWRENGYGSAEAYAQSFSDRLKQLTEKMSGFDVDENGNATYTGVKNLGMNPEDVMQWQAVYAQMTDSLGLAEETTLRFSKALTMLGADWASLRNLTFDQGWNKFASALSGQSRAVRSLGIDITNATLQEYAYKYGLEQAVSEMNQATKAQLRLLAMLDQSKVAYGDLANTIASPSNQLRMLQQNFSNLSRTIGNLFLPVVEEVLPYVNGLVIALQRLFGWVGELLGIKFDSINSSTGGMSDDIAGMVDGAEGLGDALDNANASAKKLKNNLQGWHEINNITTKEDSGSKGGGIIGGGSAVLDDAIIKALDDYEKKWNEAFEKMDNKAQEFADKFVGHFETVKDIIEDFAVGDYFKAGQDTSKLVAGIFNFFADAIDKVDWEQIGENIGDYLAGLDWIKILGSFGHLVWETLKAGFELWHGAFSEAPFEMTLITLTAMPKALKAITATKFVTSITKLAKKFGVLGKSANRFLQNLDATGQIFTFNSGIEAIRGKLTGLQKGVIGTTAVIGEFFLLEDGFYDLTKGSDNLVVSLAQIAVGAGVASGALYLAFGPAGLAVAAITGVVAAISGINKAMDEIRAEEIGNTIKNAMMNPGGVPIGEITAQFASAFSEAASGFDVIKEKSSEMDSVQKSIEDTWTEIYKIEEAMDNGVLSVQEGKAQLETLFTELATLTEQKFSTMNTAIMSAYGENGSFRTALNNMGVDTESAIDAMITYGYQNGERAKEIAKKLSGVEINSEEYRTLTAELASLTGEMSSFEKATSDFTYNMSSLQGKIDYSEIFLTDGSVDTEALKKYLDEAATALEEYKSSVDMAGQEISQYWNEIYNSTNATEEQKAIAKTQLDYIPRAIETMKSDAELQVVGFTDMIQNDFISKTNQIIDENIQEWQGKNAVEKWWNGVWGAGTESEYVKEAVEQQQKNIDEMSTTIEESLGNLETEGVVWASDAAKAIYGALFDSEYHFSDYGGKTVYTLNENYKSIINGATDGIADLAAQRGKDAADGYANGFDDNSETAENSAKSFVDRVMETIADAQDSHSPSKVTKALGKDAVDGYNLGVTKNTDSTISTIQKYIGSAISAFDGMAVKMSTIGAQTMHGFIDGMDSMSDKISEKAQSIADSVSNTVQTALDIHSPSRVMFSLGEYTVEGFNLGVENMFENFKKSFGQYTVNSVDYLSTGMYTADYRNALGRESVVNNEYISNYGSQNDMYETNELLREQNQLLIGLLNKETGITEDAVFKATRNKAKEFWDRTHVAPFPR